MDLQKVNVVKDRENFATHTLYTDGDTDRPDIICDSNGQVVLSLCKRCGAAEVQLFEHSCNEFQSNPDRIVGQLDMWAGKGLS